MKKHKKRIYLAGPILGCSTGEARVWRNDVKKVFEPDCECLDPMVYSSSDDPAETIVRNDLELIRKSDIILANMWKLGPGTTMELAYAKVYGVPVVLVGAEEFKASPWFAHHATLAWCGDLKGGMAHVLNWLIEQGDN